MRSHTLEALSNLSEAVARLRTWISDHSPGIDTSALVDVDEAVQDTDAAIRAAYRANETPSPNVPERKPTEADINAALDFGKTADQHLPASKPEQSDPFKYGR